MNIQSCRGSKPHNLLSASMTVGSLKRTLVGYEKCISIWLKFSTCIKLEVILLCLTTSVKDSSWWEVKIEIIDKIKDISCIKLKSTHFPIIIKNSIKPAIWLHVKDYWLVETIELIWLSTSVNSKLDKIYSKEEGVIGTVISHRGSSHPSIWLTNMIL